MSWEKVFHSASIWTPYANWMRPVGWVRHSNTSLLLACRCRDVGAHKFWKMNAKWSDATATGTHFAQYIFRIRPRVPNSNLETKQIEFTRTKTVTLHLFSEIKRCSSSGIWLMGALATPPTKMQTQNRQIINVIACQTCVTIAFHPKIDLIPLNGRALADNCIRIGQYVSVPSPKKINMPLFIASNWNEEKFIQWAAHCAHCHWLQHWLCGAFVCGVCHLAHIVAHSHRNWNCCELNSPIVPFNIV